LIRPADLGLRDSQDAPLSLVEVRENAERMAVEAALQACRYNVSKAASQLGTSRVTLYRLMRKYALDAPPAGSVIVRTGSSTLTR